MIIWDFSKEKGTTIYLALLIKYVSSSGDTNQWGEKKMLQRHFLLTPGCWSLD